MHATDDVGDNGLRRVKDAALDFELPVVGGEEVFVEMDDGVFAGFLVAKVAQYFRQIRFVAAQEFDHVLNAEFVEVHAVLASADMEERLQHFLQERTGAPCHQGHVIGLYEGGFRATAHVGAIDCGGKETVGDGLCVGVSKGLGREVVNEGGLEGFEELRERAAVGFGLEKGYRRGANLLGEHGKDFRERVRRLDGMAQAMAKCAAPLLASGISLAGIVGPAKIVGQGLSDVIQFEHSV